MPTDHDQSQAGTDPAEDPRALQAQIERLRVDITERLDRIERDLVEVKQAMALAVRREDIPDMKQVIDDIGRRLGLR